MLAIAAACLLSALLEHTLKFADVLREWVSTVGRARRLGNLRRTREESALWSGSAVLPPRRVFPQVWVSLILKADLRLL
jgi:hypothetical protein